jgi:uncharacterized protein YqgC (DUF456 family)
VKGLFIGPFTGTLKTEYAFIKHVAFAVREERTSYISGCAMIRKTVSICFAGSGNSRL